MEKICITGSAGFIGFHAPKLLRSEGAVAHGNDSMNSRYDVSLKKAREKMLSAYSAYTHTTAEREDQRKLLASLMSSSQILLFTQRRKQA